MKAGTHKCQKPCICHLLGAAAANSSAAAVVVGVAAIAAAGVWPNLILN